MSYESLPTIIQGGMGLGISGWRLAHAVSSTGQLGVVSGTALDVILVRRLQIGDPSGAVRRAMEHFPVPEMAKRILDKYLVAGGKAAGAAFKAKPVCGIEMSRHLEELLVVSNFIEVFLAKEGHGRPVGANYLEKIQLPTLPSLYGAILAGVSWVLMGAGIPRTIPGIIDRLSQGLDVSLNVTVPGAGPDEKFTTRFNPRRFFGGEPPKLKRPNFAPIVSSATLANLLLKKSTGRVDGFIVEGPTAGGHNAPPRGKTQYTDDGQPIYGKRDVADLAAFRALKKPFWLAGSYADPLRVAQAVEAGAQGVQVGTAFAFCEESDLAQQYKQRVLDDCDSGNLSVYTDPVASPTGFPFKVLRLEGTLSETGPYEARNRVCDLGYLRQPYKLEDGSLGWRCPAEPVDAYVKKGGTVEDTKGCKCICNALMSNLDLGQVSKAGVSEGALVTSGNDVAVVAKFLKKGQRSYPASDVVECLLSALPSPKPAVSDLEVPTQSVVDSDRV